MTEGPLVSVVIPTYNRKHMLARCIDSVLAQTYRSFEIVIVDDCSGDGTMEFVESRYGDVADVNIVYVRNDENRGAGASRNIGVSYANGDYIAFHDSDDEWRSDKLEKQMTLFSKCGQETGAVYSMFYMNGPDSLAFPPMDLDITKKSGHIFQMLLCHPLIGMITLVVRKDVFLETGGFNERLNSLEDYEFTIRVAKGYAIVLEPDVLATAHESENSVGKRNRDKIVTQCYIMDIYRDELARSGLKERKFELVYMEACEYREEVFFCRCMMQLFEDPDYLTLAREKWEELRERKSREKSAVKYVGSECFDKLKKLAVSYLAHNYDYCYLDAMHDKNRQQGTDTIVVGSSHAMNGIVEECFDRGIINFSISSQDIYYDFLHIKKACQEGRRPIKTCMINIGYYMLFQDLSLSKHMNYLVRKVYEPLFHDIHFMKSGETYSPLRETLESGKGIFSAELIGMLCQEWSRHAVMEQGSYYGELVNRRGNNTLALEGVEWERLSESEKDAYAKKRASDHNRLYSHKESRIENGRLIEEVATYLYERNIRTIFVIFPFTKWYNRYINPEYRKDIYQMLDGLKLPVEFFDMNELECFDDGDFLDTDHLNEEGAKKASRLLNQFLREE